jgi:hypothetical protein
MSHYEVIFENGEHSVISGDDDAQALSGIAEQHRRATAGEAGGPAGIQAVRVKRVLKYDEHPGALYESQAVPTEIVQNWFKDAVAQNQVGDLVSVPQLVAALRNGVDSMVASGPHESNYKAKETGEIKSEKWEGK